MPVLFTPTKKWNIEWNQAYLIDYDTTQCHELNTRIQAGRRCLAPGWFRKTSFTTSNNRSLAKRTLAEFSVHVIMIFPLIAWRKLFVGVCCRRILRPLRKGRSFANSRIFLGYTRKSDASRERKWKTPGKSGVPVGQPQKARVRKVKKQKRLARFAPLGYIHHWFSVTKSRYFLLPFLKWISDDHFYFKFFFYVF